MSLLTKPQTGLWKDESQNRYQWLHSNDDAQWFKIAVAACLTLSTPYIFRIVISSCSGIFLPHNQKAIGSGDEETQVMTNAKSGRQLFLGLYRLHRRKVLQMEPRHQFFYFFVVGSLILIFGSQIIVSSILVDNIATGQTALLASTNCGLFEYNNEKWGEEEASRVDNLMVERERRAASYAQECYDWGNVKRGKAMTCSFFFNSTLAYGVKRVVCPFEKKEVCVDRAQPGSAVTFDTGYLDSSLLGINTNPTYKFRRTTTCAPLSAEPPYVEHFTNGPVDHGYLYEYGSLFDTTYNCAKPLPRLSGYTMRIVGHPFEWQAPVYRMNTWATSLADPKCDFYQPIDDLKAPGLDTSQRTKTFTIIFITPLRIVYTEESKDPVFRADTRFRYVGDTRDYYYDGSPKMRAFACIDETLFCDPTETYCWHEYNGEIPEAVSGIAKDPAYWFMLSALKKSNIYDSIKLRLGRSLLAQQRVGLGRSQPLADNQWQLEAEHMFKTSLARAQFDAWSLASGEDHDEETYDNIVRSDAGEMCGMFKFHAAGYVNIPISSFFTLLAVLPLTFLLSVEVKTYKQFGCCIFRWIKKATARRKQTTTIEAPHDGINSDAFSIGSVSSTSQGPNIPAVLTALEPDQSPSSDINNASSQSLATPSTSTPLIASTVHVPRDYGSNSAANSTSPILDPEGVGEDAHGSSTERNHEWSPLLVHGILLLPWYGFRRLRRAWSARANGSST